MLSSKQPAYVPPPDRHTITRRCHEVQRSWSASTESERRGCAWEHGREPQGWSPPLVHDPDWFELDDLPTI